MIFYESIDTDNIIDVMESLAYKVLKYENPNSYFISEKQIVQLLKEEGIAAYTE